MMLTPINLIIDMPVIAITIARPIRPEIPRLTSHESAVSLDASVC